MANKFHLNPFKGKPPVARTDIREAIFIYRRHDVLVTGVPRQYFSVSRH